MTDDKQIELSSTAVGPKQKRWWGGLLITLGGVIAVGGSGLALLSVFNSGDILPIFLSVLIAYLGVRLLNRGRRHFVPVGLAALQKDPRPPILYLRPFSEDGAVNQISMNAMGRGYIEKGSWRQIAAAIRMLDTYEQYIGYAFGKLGPFVSIGDPKEGLPRLGAFRVYVGEAGDWKRMVSDLASQARYVLLQIGHSDGLMWEVDHVVNHVQSEQLILCLPNQKLKLTRPKRPKTREADRLKVYQTFRIKTQYFFPKPLPEQVGSAKFIYFKEDWEPQLSVFRSEKIFSTAGDKDFDEDHKLKALAWLNSVMN